MLAAPAAAQAATYTVSGVPADGACGAPADVVCAGLAEAAAAAASNDVFNVAPGNYASAEFTDSGITITGNPAFTVVGTLTFSGSGGTPAKLQKASIGQKTGAAVVVTASYGLQISDSILLSADSDGATFSEGTDNKIVRSAIVGGPASAGVRVTSADLSTASKKLVAESTLLVGGAAGLSANTGVNQVGSVAGPIDVVLRHVTAASPTTGLRLDASKAAAAGNITADVLDSIIQNGTATANYAGVVTPGIPPLIPPVVVIPGNTVTVTAPAARNLVGAFDANAVFLRPGSNNFRLRPGSPAINAGGFTAGESPTDIDGHDRSAAPTDLGFDEFVNQPPKAVIEVKTVPQRSTRPVTFDGSKSSDPEAGAGGGIRTYRWEFGDGKTEDTTTPTVTHTYTGEGDTTVKLTVIDAQGIASAPATVPIKLVDGLAPAVVITKPTANQRIRLTTRTTRTRTVTVNGRKVKRRTTTSKRTRIRFAGTARDKSGVKGVVLSVERISRATTSRTAARSSAATTTKRCAWLDPKKGIVLRSCSKPVLILAKLAKDGAWTYNVKSTIRLSAGLYRVIVAGQDNAGVGGNSAAAKDAIHRFRLVK